METKKYKEEKEIKCDIGSIIEGKAKYVFILNRGVAYVVEVIPNLLYFRSHKYK